MDNRKFLIQTKGKEALHHALMLAFDGAPGDKATHYKVHDGDLLLLWSEDKDAIKLPFTLNRENVVEFVWNWLQNAEKKEKYPESDYVWNLKGGFKLTTNEWGFDEESRYAFVRVSAVWVWCGK